MEQFNDYEFENYLVQRALPMMLQDQVVRPSLIQNAIFFIDETNINAAYNCFIEHKKYNPYTVQCNDPTPPPPMAPMDTTSPMAPMIIEELVNSASSSAVTDREDTPNGGKRRKRTRKRRKRRKSR